MQRNSPGPEVIKLLSFLPHLSLKLILLVNVKMPTIVIFKTFITMINMLIDVKMSTITSILTFISMVNTTF